MVHDSVHLFFRQYSGCRFSLFPIIWIWSSSTSQSLPRRHAPHLQLSLLLLHYYYYASTVYNTMCFIMKCKRSVLGEGSLQLRLRATVAGTPIDIRYRYLDNLERLDFFRMPGKWHVMSSSMPTLPYATRGWRCHKCSLVLIHKHGERMHQFFPLPSMYLLC